MLLLGNLMIWLQTESQIGTENGVNLWHYTGNAGNSWQTFSVDIGALNSPFVVSQQPLTFSCCPSLKFKNKT